MTQTNSNTNARKGKHLTDGERVWGLRKLGIKIRGKLELKLLGSWLWALSSLRTPSFLIKQFSSSRMPSTYFEF